MTIETPSWMQIHWENRMTAGQWVDLWQMANATGNRTLAAMLLEAAFRESTTCHPEVSAIVFEVADGESVYRHKQGCRACNVYFMRTASAEPCAITRLAETARAAIVYGLLNHGERSAIHWLQGTDDTIGVKIMDYLFNQASWLEWDKHEQEAVRAFLHNLNPSKLRVRDDPERRRIFLRTLCRWGLSSKINPLNVESDPINVRLLEEIAKERGGVDLVAIYNDALAPAYCRSAAGRALAIGATTGSSV